MRVLHTSSSYYPATKYGGQTFSVHLLNNYLEKKDVLVDINSIKEVISHHKFIYFILVMTHNLIFILN